jgi:hypothetical protein
VRNALMSAIVLVATIISSTAGVRSRATAKSGSNRDLLLVVNKGDRTVSIVDPESDRQDSHPSPRPPPDLPVDRSIRRCLCAIAHKLVN